jgi:hypothetical protein
VKAGGEFICACRLLSSWLLGRLNFALKVEVMYSSETLVQRRTTRRFIPEVGNIHNYRCENLKSCINEDVQFPAIVKFR